MTSLRKKTGFSCCDSPFHSSTHPCIHQSELPFARTLSLSERCSTFSVSFVKRSPITEEAERAGVHPCLSPCACLVSCIILHVLRCLYWEHHYSCCCCVQREFTNPRLFFPPTGPLDLLDPVDPVDPAIITG